MTLCSCDLGLSAVVLQQNQESTGPSEKVLPCSSLTFLENLLLMTREGQRRDLGRSISPPFPIFSTLCGVGVDSQKMGKVRSWHHRLEGNQLQGEARSFPDQQGSLPLDCASLKELTTVASQASGCSSAHRSMDKKGAAY